jgi:hypothetical protein
MKEYNKVSLVIIATLCVLSMVSIVCMSLTNHTGLAIGSAVMFAVFFIVLVCVI